MIVSEMEQPLDCSLNMCAFVVILFIEVVWGRDWASGGATLADIAKIDRTRLITGSGVVI